MTYLKRVLGTAGGDLSGSFPNPSVSQISGIPIDTTTLNDYTGLNIQADHIYNETMGLHWDGTHLWTINKADGYVSRLDVSTTVPTLVARVQAFTGTNNGRKITSNSTHVFVATLNSSRLIIISKATNQVVGIGDSGISTNRKVRDVELDGAGNVYVTSKHPSGAAAGRVDKYVITSVLAAYPSAALPLSSVSFTGTDQGEELVFANGFLWATGEFSRKVHKIDTTAMSIVSTYTHSTDDTFGIQFAYGSIWVTTGPWQDVLRFDTTTFPAGGSLIATVTIPNSGYVRDVVSDGTTLWVSDNSAGVNGEALYRISTGLGTEALVSTIPTPDPRDQYVDLAFDGTYIWVAAQFSFLDANQGLRKISVAPFGSEEQVLSYLGPLSFSGNQPAAGRFTFVGFAGLTTTSSASFVNVGSLSFDPSTFPATLGNRTRVIKFEITGGGANLEGRLAFISGGSVITGSTVIINIAGPINFSSGDLPIAPLTANILDADLNGYLVQIRQSSGVGNATLYNAQLVITYE